MKNVKTLQPFVKKAFSDLGFKEEEIQDGCWLFEKKGNAIWIARHSFLERVSQKAGIVFSKPDILICSETEVALLVEGEYVSRKQTSWSIGEASNKNCSTFSYMYRWAMAEKRAKDRVIIKLLGVSGDVYSEIESDDFNEGKLASKPVPVKNPATTAPVDLEKRLKTALSYINKLSKKEITDEVMESVTRLIVALTENNMFKEKETLENLINDKLKED